MFNLLQIDNFNKETSHLRYFYRHLIKNKNKIKGDIYEFGTYNGKTALGIALLLKKLNLSMKVYCFDSFQGFPSYHKYDDFKYLNYNKKVMFKHNVNVKLRKFISNKKITIKNISSSSDFKKVKLNLLRKKIKLLKLNNIIIVKGSFEKTIPKFFKKKRKIFSVNMDCDLYNSYNVALPYIYKNLSKGGFVHLDEYYSLKFPGAKLACDKFIKKNKIKLKKIKNFKWEFPRYYFLK